MLALVPRLGRGAGPDTLERARNDRGKRAWWYGWGEEEGWAPNEYVDVYDDPRSRHWLGVKAAGPTAPVAQQNP